MSEDVSTLPVIPTRATREDAALIFALRIMFNAMRGDLGVKNVDTVMLGGDVFDGMVELLEGKDDSMAADLLSGFQGRRPDFTEVGQAIRMGLL